MIPPSRAVASRRAVGRRRRMAKADSRAASSMEAELGVRPRGNKTPRQHDWSPVVRGQWSGSPASGFTLIELTVVMLIIATLGALILTAASNVLERAKKTQAKN